MFGRSDGVSLAALREMDPFVFEHFVAELWSLYGWTTEVSQQSGDMGIDIIAHRPTDDRRQSIQVKRYAADNKIGVGDVRQYAALDRQEGVDESVIVTTSSFTGGAVEAGEELDVTLIDGRELLEMVHDADGGEALARRYLQGNAELTGRYGGVTVVAGDPTPTRWWLGVVAGGLGPLLTVAVVVVVSTADAGQTTVNTAASSTLLGGFVLATVALHKTQPALLVRSVPRPVRVLADRGLLGIGYVATIVGVFLVIWVQNQSSSVLWDIALAVSYLVVLPGYPLAVAGIYRRVRGGLRANELTDEIDSVEDASDLLPEGGPETVAAARYLRAHAADDPDEVVPAVPALVDALDDPAPDAARAAAAALSTVADEFPGQVIDHVDRLRATLTATDDRDTGVWIADTVASLARHDPDRVRPVAADLLERFPAASTDTQNALTPALEAFAGLYPDIVGRHAETILGIALSDRPEAAGFAAGALQRLAVANPTATADLASRITTALAEDPDRPGADGLFATLSHLATLVALEDHPPVVGDEDEDEPEPDPWLRERLVTLTGRADRTPAVRRRLDPDADADRLGSLSLGPVEAAVSAGLAAGGDVRRRTWWFLAARAATDPSVLPFEATVRSLKQGDGDERELAAVAVARAAAADADVGRQYVPSLVAVLDRGTEIGVHGDVPERVVDACLRALGSVGRGDPGVVVDHVETVAAYLDHEDAGVVATAVAALRPVAAHHPERLGEHRTRIRTLADRDDPAGRVADATATLLGD